MLSFQRPNTLRLLIHLFICIFTFTFLFGGMSSKRLEGNFHSKAPKKQDVILWKLFDCSSQPFSFNWHLENQPHKLLCTFLHDTISSCSPYLYLRGCTAFSFFFLVGLCSFLMFVTGHHRGSFYHRGVWRPP